MSEVRKYRKLPVVIEAMEYEPHAGCEALGKWLYGEEYVSGCDELDPTAKYAIKTLEGWVWADPGDYIIKGVQGMLRPCKPHVFEQTYEQA